jgi:phosphatidylinositol phospholipase C delta
LTTANTETAGFLGSPELLKEKVIIKGAMSSRIDQRAPKYDASGALIAPDKDDDDDADKKQEKVSDELSEVIFFKTTGFKGFDKAKSIQPWEMSSFVETKAAKMAETDMDDFRRYNSRNMSRIYPKGSITVFASLSSELELESLKILLVVLLLTGFRFDSSNYDPYTSWNAGCQLVALNYQTPCDELYYNEAMFNRQNRCGYILKPTHIVDPSAKPTTGVKKVTVTVIDARSLPKKMDESSRPVIDPQVVLTIAGSPSDRKEWATRVVKDNGYSPTWNETTSFTITESWSVRRLDFP